VLMNQTFEYLIVVGTSLRQNIYYYKVYVIYMNLFIHGLIPLLSLIILNTMVYLRLRKITQESDVHIQQQYVQTREVMLAKVSLLIVLVFISCHSVRWIPNLYELQQKEVGTEDMSWPPWIQYTTHLSHLLTVVSTSTSFYIYFVKHFKNNVLLDDWRPKRQSEDRRTEHIFLQLEDNVT